MKISRSFTSAVLVFCVGVVATGLLLVPHTTQAAYYSYDASAWEEAVNQYINPQAITITENDIIYIADTSNHRIHKLDVDGNIDLTWGTNGTGDGQFNNTTGVGVDSSGNVYVSDLSNRRIQKFDADGSFLAKWGSLGVGNGQFNNPRGIAVDSNDNIYVADSSNHRIQKFAADGTFITKWGSFGSGDGQFNVPHGIAVDSTGNVYVTDLGNHRIQKFAADGTFITKWGSFGSGDGQLSSPRGVGVDSHDEIYVADTGNHRIQKFDTDGAYIMQFGSLGSAAANEFTGPYAVVFDSLDRALVLDTGNARVQRYVLTFTPLVIGSAATDISPVRVTLNGSVSDSDATVTERGFEYGITTSYGSEISETGTFSTGDFALDITGLTANTRYHFRAFAVNEEGTGYSDDLTFFVYDQSSHVTLYGVDGVGSNPDAPNLYTLDPSTGGKLTTLGEVGFNVAGLAFHPETDVLYGVTGGQGTSPKSLITISTSTGAGTLLGALEDASAQSIVLPDISFRSDGRLYGFSNSYGGDPATADLYTVDITSCDGDADTTCLVTKVGDSELDPYANGITFDSEDNLYFFGDGDDSFWTLDPDTGVPVQNIEFTNGSGSSYPITAATADDSDILFAARLNSGNSPADLIIINSEGSITSLNANSDMQYMSAIVFHIGDVPEEPEEESEEENNENESSQSRTKSGGTSVEGQVQNLLNQGKLAEAEALKAKFPHLFGNGTFDKLAVLKAKLFELLAAYKELTGIDFIQPANQMVRDLELGDEGVDVRQLQQLLGQNGYVLTKDGPGSPGNETTYFGALTQQALTRYQRDNNIAPAVGYFGPLTRTHMKAAGLSGVWW